MRTRARRAVKGITIAAAVGMFVVLLMGSTVTSTGSGEGCGASWPLCNGRFVPEFAVATAIEYSHRLVTGVEGILILAAAVGGLRAVQGRSAPSPLWVMIGVDAFRPDRLAAYGGRGGVAPHLDAFARDATIFDRAFTPIAQTEPAYRSLLTARWPPAQPGWPRQTW